MNINGASGTQGALSNMWGHRLAGPKTNLFIHFGSAMYRMILFSTLVMFAFRTEVYADDNQHNGNEITTPASHTPEFDYSTRGKLKFGDKCETDNECGFPHSICDSKMKKCQCIEDMPATNHLDKCGKKAAINETCTFNEQCEMVSFQTECRDGHCICRFEMSPITKKDGQIECKVTQKSREPERYVDPAMIGILAGMALMFIIICVVLRLFSRARWRENRTIFNTPNPRLMNVSLLRESKLCHNQDRRGSRTSVRAPSRQPSMTSLRPHSPIGFRRSHGSSTASVVSNRSNITLNDSGKRFTKENPNTNLESAL